jgi:prepilin-type N-terminal cleavage/methylation domain-containing protein
MKHITQKGFTMIEMLTVLAIFAVLTSVVLFNYTKFRSDTILTNMAYEIALSIREAQIYGVSARGVKIDGGPSLDFSVSHGIYIPADNSNQYFLFADNDGDSEFTGTSCAATSDICVTPYSLLGSIKITDIQIEGQCSLDPESLSIVFRRPNPEPIISDDLGTTNISRVQVTVTAQDGVTERYIVVANNGQVSVENKSICP